MTELTETQEYLLRAGLQTDYYRIRHAQDYDTLMKLSVELRQSRLRIRNSIANTAATLKDLQGEALLNQRMIEEVDEALDRVLPPRGN